MHQNLYYISMNVEEDYPGRPRALRSTFAYHIPDNSNTSIQINGIGLKELMKPCWNVRNRGNSDFLMLYFYDPVQFALENQKKEIISKKWIILTPEKSHMYGNSHEEWSHSWIHFSGKYLENLLYKHKIPVNTLQSLNDHSHFENLLIRIHEEIYFNSIPDEKIIGNELESSFIRLFRQTFWPDYQIPVPDLFSEIKQLLDFNYQNKYTLKSLAKISGYSTPYLCNKFKEYFQLPPIEYLINRRIEIAKYFLEKTDWNINEIACRVGYNDLFYFSRLFKERTGKSPRQYRKNGF